MVDRRERRDLQDGKGKDRQSKCHVHYQRRGLGRDVERETQRHMGLYDWQAKSPRPAIGRSKARRNLPLKFRLDLELDERCRARSGARFSPKEIEVAPNRATAAERDFKRLEARIGRLHSSLILAVLDPCVVHLQLPFWRYDILGAETCVIQISKEPKFPIVTWVVNQGRFWEDAFEAQMVVEEPDDTAAGGDYRIRIDRATDADYGEDFVFLKRKGDPRFPRNVECIPLGITLEVGPRIDLDTRAGMIMYHVFNSQ